VTAQRRWGRWIATGAAVAVLACLGSVALVVIAAPGLLDRFRAPSADQVLARVEQVLAGQSAALLTGDEAGYLAPVDAAMAGPQRAQLTRQFHSLRAMRVATWQEQPRAAVERSGGLWAVNVFSHACFVTAECAPGSALTETTWRIEGDRTTLVSWRPSRKVHPWQVSALVSAPGERVIVATTPDYSERLPSLLAEAETASLVADRFAEPGKVPARYVVYFAGPAEWQLWFGFEPAEWFGGAAVEISQDRYELVLNGDDLDRSAIDDLLRHELTHAASLPGPVKGPVDKLWWLIEGIAELAEMRDNPARSHPGTEPLAQMLSAGTITGVELTSPGREASEETALAHYAMAYLTARCLADRFGEPKLVTFFHRVLHDGKTPAEAATLVLQADWAELSAQCLAFARQTTG
jgi:hypothetical protein